MTDAYQFRGFVLIENLLFWLSLRETPDMKLWLTLASITGAYNPLGFAPQPTEAPSKILNLQESNSGSFAGGQIREIHEGKNFGPANEGNGLLPMGLRCNIPTPRSNGRSMVADDIGGRIVNGTEAGFNWPFIVRLKPDGIFQSRV